jgi:hypothetical protein
LDFEARTDLFDGLSATIATLRYEGLL